MWLFLVLAVAALVPLVTVGDLPMIDYPNHLARMHAVVALDRDPVLARFYGIQWVLVPNLAMDLLVPPLARLFDIYTAGRLFVVPCMALTATGVFAVSWALNRRVNPFQFTVFLFVYNYPLLEGLMNYVLGIGLALWGLAAWIHLRQSRLAWRAAVSSLFVLLLFVAHLSALGLYGLGLLCFEGWWLVRHRRRPWRRTIADFAVFGLPFLAVAPLMLLSPTEDLATFPYFTMANKLDAVQWLYLAYNDNLDGLWAILIACVVALAAVLHSVRVHPAGWILLGAGLAVFLAMPRILLGSYGADMRIPVGVVYLCLPFVRAEFSSLSGRRAFVAALAALALWRFAAIEIAWRPLAADISDIRHSFELMPRGSRILAVEADAPHQLFPSSTFWWWNRPFAHSSCLSLIERSDFAADAFVQPGKHILQVRPEFRDSANVLDDDQPLALELDRAARQPDQRQDSFYYQWWRNFDYVYLLYTGEPGAHLPPHLTRVYGGQGFELYRVDPQTADATPEATPLLAARSGGGN